MAATQGGALADFAKRPLGFKVLVFVGAGALLGLVYWQFLLHPLQRKYKQAQAYNAQLVVEGGQLDTKLKQFKDLQKTQASLEHQIEEDRKALPTEAELPAFFDTLNRKVGDAGVEVKKWEYKRELPVEDFYRVPVEIEMTGTFEQIKRFFSSLLPHESAGSASGDLPTEKERIITIEDLSLSNPRVQNGEIVLTAKFTASTFRQDQPEETDKDKAKDTGKGAGAGTPATGAAPPPPSPPPPPPHSAGAPAVPNGGLIGGVKSDVDKAMKESKDRAKLPGGPSGGPVGPGSDKLKGGM
jgi:type IV pilus assembly protein PilO